MKPLRLRDPRDLCDLEDDGGLGLAEHTVVAGEMGCTSAVLLIDSFVDLCSVQPHSQADGPHITCGPQQEIPRQQKVLGIKIALRDAVK